MCGPPPKGRGKVITAQGRPTQQLLVDRSAAWWRERGPRYIAWRPMWGLKAFSATTKLVNWRKVPNPQEEEQEKHDRLRDTPRKQPQDEDHSLKGRRGRHQERKKTVGRNRRNDLKKGRLRSSEERGTEIGRLRSAEETT